MSNRELALTLGFAEEYAALQAFRHASGDPQPRDLLRLPAPFRRGVLKVLDDGDPRALEQGLRKFEELVDLAPASEAVLLRMAFNFGKDHGNLQWTRRVEKYAKQIGTDEKTVRGKVDLAILQLLQRTREGAEKVPEPVSPPAPADASARAARFFDQDYVRNSARFADAWQSSKSVDMCGFGHNRMLVAYSSEIVNLMQSGGALRVLLQEPEGSAVLLANQRSSTPKASEDSVRHQHRAGLATLASLRRSAGGHGQLQVRAYDIVPPFTGYFFDPDSDGVAFIWFWSWRQASSWRPGFYIRRDTDQLWFDRFHSQFRAMWADTEISTPLEVGA
ncbi:hypothetical protein A5719_10705 [Mycolicibacterium peregrinum]|uniref:DUF5919 domain-containing protein n=1 Tax=Mycolicibacterium peregrinum TaxID=43304 RepID=UPI0007EAF96A|nr:DUF5919 domain-containing protein [Mycolicibacterium peregrinum]OBF41849.1 hypothetical protein A5719_10705 [Mycolicibacterium peregrinum]